MAVITYPLLTVTDDAGTIVSDATVTITAVTTRTGAAIAGHGAVLNRAGANVSVDYDPVARGEAWITLGVARAGSIFTGLSAAPSFYLARDIFDLDGISIAPPAGVAGTFREMMVQLWRRFFRRHTRSSTQIRTYADDDATIRTTQAITASGTDETVGSAT